MESLQIFKNQLIFVTLFLVFPNCGLDVSLSKVPKTPIIQNLKFRDFSDLLWWVACQVLYIWQYYIHLREWDVKFNVAKSFERMLRGPERAHRISG